MMRLEGDIDVRDVEAGQQPFELRIRELKVFGQTRYFSIADV